MAEILLIANTFLFLYAIYGIFEVWWNGLNPVRVFLPLLRLSLNVMTFLVLVIGGAFAVIPAYIALGIYACLLVGCVIWFSIMAGVVDVQ